MNNQQTLYDFCIPLLGPIFGRVAILVMVFAEAFMIWGVTSIPLVLGEVFFTAFLSEYLISGLAWMYEVSKGFIFTELIVSLAATIEYFAEQPPFIGSVFPKVTLLTILSLLCLYALVKKPSRQNSFVTFVLHIMRTCIRVFEYDTETDEYFHPDNAGVRAYEIVKRG